MNPEFEHEQPADDGGELSRRGFLRLAGYSAAALSLVGCRERPPQTALPYTVKPVDVTPGRPVWYASTCQACSAGCGLLVKCRDGRPIKLEGNPRHPLSQGRLCAAGQAAVLGVYDSLRLRGPLLRGEATTWQRLDDEVVAGLDRLRRGGGSLRVLTSTITSPTVNSLLGRLLATVPGARHVVWDSLSSAAILDAHRRTHGARVLPRYRFDRAAVIVAVDADFLGTWIAPVEYTAAYQAGRSLASADAPFSEHVQVESRLSLTGCRADRRIVLPPSALTAFVADLAAAVAARAGLEPAAKTSPDVARLADRLWQARGQSLVVCGLADAAAQDATNRLNLLLDNYGHTLDLAGGSYQRQGDDAALAELAAELRAGTVGGLVLAGVNPVYDLPDGAEWAKLIAAVPISLSCAERIDETSAAVRLVAPEHHPLEAWGDAEAVGGVVSLQQPAINPLGETRSLLESLAVWSADHRTAPDIIADVWRHDVWPRRRQDVSFDALWDQALSAGVVEVNPVAPAWGQPQPPAATAPRPAAEQGLELVVYPKVALLDGRGAHNPWLQELPDPVSKVSWDNYASLAPGLARQLGVKDGDEVKVTVGQVSLALPARVQVGQDERTVAVALGYGRQSTARFAHIGPRWLLGHPTVGAHGLVGHNAAPWRAWANGLVVDRRTGVQVAHTGRKLQLALAQTQDTLVMPAQLAPKGGERRPIVQTASLDDWRRNPHAGGEAKEAAGEDLWGADHPYQGHHWAMVIDLAACTGCSACVIACQVENNVPVVGKDEVARRREMHWIRIDRYLDESPAGLDIAHQPMLCHHCDNAPCEVVCPVLATVHSAEGLNQQVYNRCVGTRYCANNCPYKVRRFNWFDYPHDDLVENLVLNPDVTVRTRGVMEKCTFCVQRIETAKMEARREGRVLADGDVQPACAQSCPARAIVFGDRNDPQSAVAAALRNPRRYQVLDDLGLQPAVSYLRQVHHRADHEEPHHG